jgi:hypothetical protein
VVLIEAPKINVFTSWIGLISDSVVALIPVDQLDHDTLERRSSRSCRPIVTIHDGGTSASLSQSISLDKWQAKCTPHKVMGVWRQWSATRQHETNPTSDNVPHISEDDSVHDGCVPAQISVLRFVSVAEIEQLTKKGTLFGYFGLDALVNSVNDKWDSAKHCRLQDRTVTLGAFLDLGGGVDHCDWRGVPNRNAQDNKRKLTEKLHNVCEW